MRMNEFFYLFVIMSILIITRSNPLIKEFQMQSIAKHIFFPNKDYETILDGMVDLAVYFVNKILNTTESQTISPECRTNLEDIINNKTGNLNFYVEKFIDDSSKNTNDLTTYYDCMTKNYNYNLTNNETMYLLLDINRKNIFYNTSSDKSSVNTFYNYTLNYTINLFNCKDDRFITGFCLPRACSVEDYRQLSLIGYNYSSLKQEQENMTMKAIGLSSLEFNRNVNNLFSSVNFVNFIPFFIVIIFFIIVAFHIVPFCIYKVFFKNPNYSIPKEEQQDKKNTIKSDDSEIKKDFNLFDSKQKELLLNQENVFDQLYNKKAFLQFKDSMKFSHNFEELFNYTIVTSQLNNDSGITYIKGLEGLSMLFLIFGNTFYVLFNTPVSVVTKYNVLSVMRNLFYWVFYIGLKFASKVLLSCSGYCLFFKMMNYLDDSFDEIVENENETNKERDDTTDLDKSNDNSNDRSNDYGNDMNKVDIVHKAPKRKTSDIKFYLLFKFYLYQIHKYLIYIMLILFIQFSLYDLFKLLSFGYTGPLWQTFHDNMRLSFKESIPKSISFFTATYSFIEKTVDNQCFLNFFWLVENEIIFFVITSLLIFIGYKYKIKINNVVNGIILLTVVAEFCLYILSFGLDKLRLITYFKRTSWYFYTFDFGNVLTNPLHNYMFYLIGVFFGSCNYVLQKGLTGVDVDEEDKIFLFASIKFVKFYKSRTKHFLLFFAIGLILTLYLIANIQTFSLLIAYSDDNYEQFTNSIQYIFDWNPFNNSTNAKWGSSLFGIVFLLDTVLTVVIVHILCFGLYLKGENYINDFLTHPFWTIFHRLHFSFIIIINPIILYILLQSESRITFNLQNCLLYSFITFFFTFIISSIVYGFFEMPLKRIVKLFFNNQYIERSNNFDFSNSDNKISMSSYSYKPLFFENKEKDA